MGRRRKEEHEKKGTLHLSITNKVIDEFKREAEERGEVPSHIIEEFIIKYLDKNSKT